MRLAASLLVAPVVRNLVWDLTTMSFWSSERLNKVNPENPRECIACGMVGTTHHLFFTCELSSYVLNLTRMAIRASGLPEISMTEKNYLFVNPPKGSTDKRKYKGIRASIANSLNFMRQLINNPTICFSSDLFLKIFQETHRQGERIFNRSGGLEFPWFLVRGNLESLNLDLPIHLKSPLIKHAPALLNRQLDIRREAAKAFDPLLRDLFPDPSPPKLKFTGELSVSARVLTNLMVMTPGTVSSKDEITSYFTTYAVASDLT